MTEELNQAEPNVDVIAQEEAIVETEVTETHEAPEEEKKRETLTLPEKILEPKEGYEIVDGVEYTKELMDKARLAGYLPLKEGAVDRNGKLINRLDPETFVERGEKAIPFLHKTMKKQESIIEEVKKENSSLVEMVKKLTSRQVQNDLERVESKLQDAITYGETEKMEKLISQKMELQGDMDSYNKPIEEPVQQNQSNKPVEMVLWEDENAWVVTPTNPYEFAKKQYAQEQFDNISRDERTIGWTLDDKFKMLDVKLKNYDNDYSTRANQRRNVMPPTQSAQSSINTTSARSIGNLTPSALRLYNEMSFDGSGKKYTGEALESYRKTYLESCDQSHFKN